MRPLMPVAGAYTLGLLLGNGLGVSLVVLFVCSFFLLSALLLQSRNAPWLLGALLVFTGWIHFEVQTAQFSPWDLRAQFGPEAEYATIRGTLRQTPILTRYQSQNEEQIRSVAEIEVHAVLRGTHWAPARGRILSSTPEVLDPRFFRSQKVEVFGVVSPPRSPTAPGLFNFASYLQRRSIYFQLQIHETNDWKLASTSPRQPLMADRFSDWAKKVLSRGLPHDASLDLLWAMTLGWKTGLTDELAEPFMQSGTMHIFAISGLHIALITGILVSLLRVLRIPRALCGAIIIPLIWFYTQATGWQPSAIRSTIMMSIVTAGWSLHRPSNLQNSLGGAAFIILLWDPQQLFQAGFQLSFFVVLSIALLVPWFDRGLAKLLASDPLLPAELRPRWRQVLDRPLHWFTVNFATSLAAWLGSLPLIAYYFHLLTPASLIANMLIVPMSGLALMCNLGSLFCGDWFPLCTELFNHSAWFLMNGMVLVSQQVIRLPGAYFYASVSLLECLLFYSVLITLLAPAESRRKWRLPIGLGLSVLACGCLAVRAQNFFTTEITVLPLSGGSSIHVRPAKNHDQLLVDCGNAISAEKVVKPYLAAQGINTVDHFLLSQGGIQQIGGAAVVLDNFRVGTLFRSPAPSRSLIYKSVLDHALEKNIPVQQIQRGGQMDGWMILHPGGATNRFGRADDQGVVLKGTLHGIRLLLLGDLGPAGQSELLNLQLDLRAEIVISGLPSYGEPLNRALVEAISPRLVIICDSEYPAAARASSDLKNRLGQNSFPVWFASEEKSVRIFFRSQRCWLENMRGGRHQIR